MQAVMALRHPQIISNVISVVIALSMTGWK
jgi:hypothetical protein